MYSDNECQKELDTYNFLMDFFEKTSHLDGKDFNKRYINAVNKIYGYNICRQEFRFGSWHIILNPTNMEPIDFYYSNYGTIRKDQIINSNPSIFGGALTRIEVWNNFKNSPDYEEYLSKLKEKEELLEKIKQVNTELKQFKDRPGKKYYYILDPIVD